jgi:hypothetical protein
MAMVKAVRLISRGPGPDLRPRVRSRAREHRGLAVGRLIEAADATGEPFGYDSVLRTLQGSSPDASAADVRNRLLATVERHVGSQPPGDHQGRCS